MLLSWNDRDDKRARDVRKIFIAHATQDAEIAEQIALELKVRGYSASFDEDSLPTGYAYDARIRRAINAADLFVFLLRA